MGRSPGRIPKLTDTVSAAYCEAVRAGMSQRKASDLCGLSYQTVTLWLRKGRRSNKGIYYEFHAKVLSAMAEFIAENLKSVRRAARRRRVRTVKTTTFPDGRSQTEETFKAEFNWAAAKWLLECKDRESFGPDRHELALLKKEITELKKLILSGRQEPPADVGP